MSIQDQLKWNERYCNPKSYAPNHARQLLVEHIDLIPPNGTVVDFAMGTGNNAGFLIDRGVSVLGIDISNIAVQAAKKKHPKLSAVIADLPAFYLPDNYFDAILNFYYLERTLWKEFPRILKPGGILFFETLTRSMQSIKPEISAPYLLDKEELLNSFSGWEILYYKEGWTTSDHGKQKSIASMIARLPD